MDNNLLYEFEKELNNEAKRIVDEMIEMYNKKIKVDKDYGEIVRMLMSKKFDYYSCELELRSYKFLPVNLEPDNKGVYTLVSDIENTQDHLLKYINWCKNDVGDKDHKKVANEMAKVLIDYGNKHKKTTKSFIELVAELMPNFFPTHHDSVDSRAVVLLIQEEFNKVGYKVSSLTPFRLSNC